MKFKNDLTETIKYASDLFNYIQVLNDYLSKAYSGMEKAHDKGNKTFMAYYDITEDLRAYIEYLTKLQVSISFEMDVPDNFVAEITKQKEKISTGLNNFANSMLDSNEKWPLDDSEAMNIFNLPAHMGKFMPAIINIPENALEVPAKNNNKPQENTSKTKENPNKAQYIAEFERLAKELKGTNPWYSKGSQAYQDLEADIALGLEQLKNPNEKDFDKNFKDLIKRVNQRSAAYEAAHKGKLDDRQMKRLKIMNRFNLLGKAFERAEVNPQKDYERKIAEKYIQATAIRTLSKRPTDKDANTILRSPDVLSQAVEDVIKNATFQKSLPKNEADLLKIVKTNGGILHKDLTVKFKQTAEDLQFIDKIIASIIEKTFSKESQPRNDKALQDQLEKMFQAQSEKEILDDIDIDEIEKQFAEMEPVQLNTASSKDLRHQRLEQEQFSMYDVLLCDKEMENLEATMLDGPEFTDNEAIPANIRYCNSIETLEAFKNENKNLSNSDKKYIDSRIATEKFYSKLEEQRLDPVTTAPVEKDGTVILEHIHLDTLQTTNNGCYSCSEMLLLQSRGLNLDQRQIRNYRVEGDSSFSSVDEQDRTQGDKMGNIVDIGGIATRCLKNTALREKTYIAFDRATPETKLKVGADIMRTVKDAVYNHHSPVSLLRGMHYVTIVGYNEDKGTFIYKNSLTDRDFYEKHLGESVINPDEKHEMTMDELLSTSKLAIGYLMTVDPKKPMKNFDDCPNFEYVEGQYMENDTIKLGLNKDTYCPDGRVIMSHKRIGEGNDQCTIQSSVKVPKRLDLTPEMKKDIGDKFKIKPLKDDPEKQKLMEDIANKERDFCPDKDAAISVSGTYNPVSEKWTGLSFKCGEKDIPSDQMLDYLYLQKLKSNIDIMTPWQVKHAFDPDRIKASREVLPQNVAYSAFRNAVGKTVPLSTLAKDVYNASKPAPQLKQNQPNNVIQNNVEADPEIKPPVKDAPVLQAKI